MCYHHHVWAFYKRTALRALRTLRLLHLISKWSRATLLLLAKFINLAIISLLPKIAFLLVIPTTRPIAILIVATLVIAAGLFLQGVWRIPWTRRMPTSLLKNKPDISCPENKVQESKDLNKKQDIKFHLGFSFSLSLFRLFTWLRFFFKKISKDNLLIQSIFAQRTFQRCG